MRLSFRTIIAAAVLLGLSACGFDEDRLRPDEENDAPEPISISGEISQVYQTRANDSGFADKDEIGIYIVDYEGETSGTLKNSGNRADNVRFVFDEATYKWTPEKDIFWKNKTTHVDVYGYYPYSSIEKVENYLFEVQKDQSTEAANGKLAGYEASDFLWGKAENAAQTDKIIRLSFMHKLSGVRVSLVEGTGFASGEWASASKDVLILGTKRNASINMATGEATAIGDAAGAGITPYHNGGDYRAVVIPQQVAAGTTLIAVTINGIPYRHARSEATVFTPSKQHNFTITVNKKVAGGYEFTMSDESITAWENDAVSHDATTKEYVIINVETPGTLDKCIEAAGKDLAKIRNLKVTGKINANDFDTLNEKMTALQSLNLKDVKICKSNSSNENEIPSSAFRRNKSLANILLPDSITSIGEFAFGNCNLTGSLIIPDGVVVIHSSAFSNCLSLTGVLSLPESLERIEDSAFYQCSFVSELNLPSSVKYIGASAFYNCSGLYGTLELPEGLTYLGEGAFGQAGFTGNLVIPKGVTKIGRSTFRYCKFNGTLTMHDDIVFIGEEAFNNCGFKGELVLPQKLIAIEPSAFYQCNFSGRLVLPSSLNTIGRRAFCDNKRLSGVLELPENVTNVPEETFSGCSSLEGVIVPDAMEVIMNDAFKDCFGINKITCKGVDPPLVQSGAFDGVAKDNFTVEAPESAVVKYQTAPGWKDFKRISAYRNLVIRPASATALNATTTRDLVLNADDEWIVESMPDWVKLSQKEGKGKTELTLTFSQMPAGSGRDGSVVFKLKDKDYRTTLSLAQYDYSHAQDEIITLRKATKGNGVNLVFLGDGFDAKDISEGLLLKDINEAVGHFFDIEPYKTYKDYFNVYTGIAVSPESGIGGVNTIINNRFNTYVKRDVKIGALNGDSDYNEIFKYACKAPTVNEGNLNQTLIVIVPNTTEYGGICYMYDGGEAIAYCPMSDNDYPLDFRGIVQHEAGGHGFGKLGDEYIYHNAFIDACICDDCGHVDEFNAAKAKGWYDNLSLTGKLNSVPWNHLIFHEKYSGIVDIYEGGYMHSRGVYRSESTSCMNNNIPYYSTISREAMVKRIMKYAGQEFSFEDFVAKDKIENLPETADAVTKGGRLRFSVSGGVHDHGPVFMGKRPAIK